MDRDSLVRPDYYDQDKIECIDVIKQLGYFEDFCMGSALKYLWRHGRKDHINRIADLKKARTYITFLIDHLEKQTPVAEEQRKEFITKYTLGS